MTVRPRISSLLGDALYQQQLTEQLARARAALDPAEAEAQRVGVDCESDILEGDPVDCIAQAARGWRADLVVVGSRGHGTRRERGDRERLACDCSPARRRR